MISLTGHGLYVQPAGVYIDPWKKVDRAVITHAHADHARPGMGHYACHILSKPVLQLRLGKKARITAYEYGEQFTMNGVHFSLQPAGHVPGSAQVRIEYNGEVWVVTGDFKTENDGISQAFEPIPCHKLVMESTFGLPVFRWKPQQLVLEEILAWWRANRDEGRISILHAYPLGKAQRLIHLLGKAEVRTVIHPSIAATNEALSTSGLTLPETTLLSASADRAALLENILLLPAMASDRPWVRRLGQVSTAMASGWMALGAMRRRAGIRDGFVLSDHADWKGLNEVVQACQPERVFTMHGYQDAFARWLRETGADAATVEVLRETGHHNQAGTVPGPSDLSSNATLQ